VGGVSPLVGAEPQELTRRGHGWLTAFAVAAAVFGCGGPPHDTEVSPPRPGPSVATSTPAPSVSNAGAAQPTQAKQDWVARSNENAKLLLTITSKFAPETSSRYGVDGLDDQIVDLKPGHEPRQRGAYRTVLEELGRRMATENDALVKQDLSILRNAATLAIKRSEVEEKNLVPYRNPTEIAFDSALGLLDDQIVPARRPAIVARFRKYAGMEGGAPIVDLIKAEIVEAMKHAELAMPAKIEVEKNLGNNATMREGIGKLLQKYEIKNYEEPLKLLSEQLAKFDEFVKTTVLPKTRANFALPPPVYAVALEGYGVDLPPAELTVLAHDGFNKIQAEMKVVAAEVAKAKKLPSSDYRDVIKALKKEQLTGDAILQHYKDRLAEVETIIRREKLVTLPSRPARIRLGTPAENAQQPAPHMNPPRLLGNTGEQGEFVLPLEVPREQAKGAPPKGPDAKLDDFTFAAASWTLTAHEARPGHEMQFAAMVERGVSSARAIYAFNSANVEGWGLYSEAIVYPFMPPEGKLISLQLRLQRAVRAFIDPELQQGKWTFDSAKAFLMKEVGLSPAFAKSEVERYTFRAPGQATSYYYGFSKLEALRRELETKLGPKFDAMKFHDFILAQGLLPPDLMRGAALKEFK
jgi:hypothetical protein